MALRRIMKTVVGFTSIPLIACDPRSHTVDTRGSHDGP